MNAVNKQRFMIRFLLSIVLCFGACAFLHQPAYAQKSPEMLELCLLLKNSPSPPEGEELNRLRERYLAAFDRTCRETAAMVPDENFVHIFSALPAPLSGIFTEIIYSAKRDISAEKKAAALADIFGEDCTTYLYYTIIAAIIEAVDIVPYDWLISKMLGILTVLCFLGAV